MHRPCKILAALLSLSLLTGCTGTVIEEPPFPAESKSDADFSIADIRAGDDFYGYINAQSLMEMTLKEDENSVGTLDTVQETVDSRIKDIIKEIAASDEAFKSGTPEDCIRRLYDLAYDTHNGTLDTDKADTDYIESLLDQVKAADSMEALFAAWAMLMQETGFSAVLEMNVGANPFNTDENIVSVAQFAGPGDLEEMTEEDYALAEARNILQDALYHSGVDYEEAKTRAADIVYLLLDLAGHTDFQQLEEYDPGKATLMTEQEFDSTMQHLTCKTLYQLCGIEKNPSGLIGLADADHMRTLDKLLSDENLNAWKDYTAAAFLNAFGGIMPEKYHPSNETEDPQPEKAALDTVQSTLVRQVGECYAAKYFDENKRTDITDMCDRIVAEYDKLISGADWLSADARSALKNKLHAMTFFIGADEPAAPDPAFAEMIGDSMMRTSFRLNAYRMHEQFSQITSAPTKNGFEMMPPHTVNACYVPDINCFNITAAILNAPLYDENAEDAVNLGAIGTVIGHEISHAFDNEGMKYDAEGNYRPEWIQKADRDAFQALADRAIEYWNGFTVLQNRHVNGRKTLDENLADLSGVQCILDIAGTPEKQKLALESYARTWKTLIRDTQAEEQLRTDVHSPENIRVNAIVACFDVFYELYDVTEDDAMYVAPEDRIRRW